MADDRNVLINVIPTPKRVSSESGDFGATIAVAPKILVPNGWEDMAEAFIETVKKAYGFEFSFGTGGIEVKIDGSVRPDGYILATSPFPIIECSAREGAAYGLSTLVQLFSYGDGKPMIPDIKAEDYPDTEYRGVMACASCERVLKMNDLLTFADACYLYKMKYLHVHFSDNAAYALPSKAFPRLPSEDAYTAGEIEKLKKYCAARGITVIPEIDLPGHAAYIIKKYPELFKNSGRALWEDGKEVAEEAICVGNEKAFWAMETLLEEVSELFPDSPYIHIGGDEVNVRTWNACAECNKLIKDLGLNDAEDLYAYSIKRLAEKVISLGKRPVVWEGFDEKKADMIPKECIIGVFESLYCTADKLIEKGFDVINCSWEPLYSVSWGAAKWWRDANSPWGYKEILSWDKFTFKNKYMKTSPVHLKPMHLPPTDKIIGAQMCDWAKYFSQKIPYIREFVPAVSERLWTNERLVTDERFFDKYITTTAVFDELTEKRNDD